MPTELTKPNEFRNSLSLKPVAEALAKELLKKRPLKDLKKYCLGVHVRHVFDTTSPTVHVESSDADLAKEILENNEGRGNQTLNHVLDALLGTCSDGDLAAFVTVSFKTEKAPACVHPFDRYDHETTLAGGTIPDDTLLDELKNALNGFAGVHKTCASFCHLPDIAEFSPPSERQLNPVDYYCGSMKFCARMGIPVAPLALSSIWRAIIQLGQYAGESKFGNETATFLLRGSDPFGFVVGFTLITDTTTKLGPAELSECCKCVLTAHAQLNPECELPDSYFSPACKVLLHRISKFQGMVYSNVAHGKVFPRQLARLILQDVTSGCSPTKESRFPYVDDDDGLLASVEAFILLASQFCDEKVEGRQLRFGLVHGSPSLMFHWDGPSPIPLAVTEKFIPFASLPKQFHLIEDPEDRCLVVPYLPPQADPDYPHKNDPKPQRVEATSEIPSFALELRHFKEAFAESDRIQLWTEEFRPYAYFTERHRWAVACVVGPYSELRVFTCGTITAFRDGKGWKILRELPKQPTSLGTRENGNALHPWQAIVAACPQWKGGFEPILRALIELAIQLSPIANRHAKGGLVLYAPKSFSLDPTPAPTDRSNLWFDERGHSYLQDLSAVEPDRLPHENGRPWVTNRPLLKDGDVLDEEVAHRLLRACSQDGAAVISGAKGLVQAFAKRANPPAIVSGDPLWSEQDSASGTKHYTAAAFVNMVAKCSSLTDDERKLGLGIAISSDGKITVASVKTTEGGKFEQHKTVLFRPYEEVH